MVQEGENNLGMKAPGQTWHTAAPCVRLPCGMPSRRRRLSFFFILHVIRNVTERGDMPWCQQARCRPRRSCSCARHRGTYAERESAFLSAGNYKYIILYTESDSCVVMLSLNERKIVSVRRLKFVISSSESLNAFEARQWKSTLKICRANLILVCIDSIWPVLYVNFNLYVFLLIFLAEVRHEKFVRDKIYVVRSCVERSSMSWICNEIQGWLFLAVPRGANSAVNFAIYLGLK
jgi:hypothetical protein